MMRIGRDGFEGGGSIDVPECGHHQATNCGRNRQLQLRIEHTDTARLHDQVGLSYRMIERRLPTLRRSRIDHDPRPVRIGYIAMALPLERVGLEERNVMTKFGKSLQ